jgi:hypothetical protein
MLTEISSTLSINTAFISSVSFGDFQGIYEDKKCKGVEPSIIIQMQNGNQEQLDNLSDVYYFLRNQGLKKLWNHVKEELLKCLNSNGLTLMDSQKEFFEEAKDF